MALTISNIHSVLNNVVRPEKMTLVDMVTIFSHKHAQYFLDTQKETDAGTLADNYRLKMVSLAKKCKSKDGQSILSLVDSLIINIANFETYANLKSLTDSGWETLVETNIPTAFGKVADVTSAEETAYNAL